MKKITICLLVFVLLIGMTACSNQDVEDLQAQTETVSFFEAKDATVTWNRYFVASVQGQCVLSQAPGKTKIAIGRSPNGKIMLGIIPEYTAEYYEVKCLTEENLVNYCIEVYNTHTKRMKEQLKDLTWDRHYRNMQNQLCVEGHNQLYTITTTASVSQNANEPYKVYSVEFRRDTENNEIDMITYSFDNRTDLMFENVNNEEIVGVVSDKAQLQEMLSTLDDDVFSDCRCDYLLQLCDGE